MTSNGHVMDYMLPFNNLLVYLDFQKRKIPVRLPKRPFVVFDISLNSLNVFVQQSLRLFRHLFTTHLTIYILSMARLDGDREGS